MTVEGVSAISLATTNEDVFASTSKLYRLLGFKLVRNYSAMASHGPNNHLRGFASDSIKEHWLEAFPLQTRDSAGNVVPWQDLRFYVGDNTRPLCPGTLVKLRLSGSAQCADGKQDLLFFSTNMTALQDVFEQAAIQCQVSAEGVLSASDPLGNTLRFSGTLPGSGGKKFSSPEEYLESQSAELIKALEQDQPLPPANRNTPPEPKKKKIGVMTSGGDAPGMNPAVRAVVRAGIYYNCDMFAVYEGYEGLVRGGDLLKPMGWNDVRGLLSHGGTDIGTARCAAFRERAGRLQGAYNMVVNGIDALIVCGGDGSLTGADLFRSEWPSLIEELIETKKLTRERAEPYRHLTIVGLVGSIDNDMAGTDATIGAFSSLERISEMVDYIDETAASHSRAFVVEVMGRHCGWLGLMSGLSTGADYIFIPERPPKHGQWQDELKAICSRHRSYGKRNTTVIVAEGAVDDELNPISSETVKNVLVELGLDTRITTLGHVQRGGTAVAYDRMLSTLQGVEAVKAVLESTPEVPSPVIGILENQIVRQPLVDSVRLTKQVADSIEAKDFDRAMSLRDSTFAEAYENFLYTALYDDGSKLLPESERLNIGIVHVGASLSALNATTRAAALYCLAKGHKLFAIQNGFSGLINEGTVKELSWLDVDGWHNQGGSEIGTNRSLPSENFGDVAYYMQRHKFNGLMIVGGFEAFTALHQLEAEKKQYPIFNIPKVVIPATVSNNVPGTEYSLGSDTCLNQLVNYCDAIKQSASATRRRVFVVEVQGGNSGYVACYAGLVTGAIAVYRPEDKIDLKSIREDIDLLFDAFKGDRGEDNNGKIVIRNEFASPVYTTDLLSDIFWEAAGSRFETRTAIPGHVQQGFTPSSMDRVYAARFAVQSVKYIEDWSRRVFASVHHNSIHHSINNIKMIDLMRREEESSVVIGIQGAQLKFSDINNLYEEDTDVALRKGQTIHWSNLADVGDMLSGRLGLRERRQR
ncbi:6-phosphofructokinase [Metschnikowia bicuspidata var. bicuspidata NRRL YB-4993]|uniref:ATP-dependent 6-phosphofructokinase n=1 Tax=Metschnikowia bicuspidata var. bicuspidata NRRL YB-4993 TaxID=869754 RepID=A0A1A0H5H7_9ASCO|nr:6-phosphofructokinase [Metschnikowia bicuspidata var. bicuspidata NRRL YB-4993]OBA19344.1 6-phosphofructokinase [Metschnikowia bicuspidata var. bicuspidata NRRL YB-4993]